MLNKTVLQGRLVADPEIRYTQAGVPVASFKVAWSEKYNNNETKCFLPCVAWRNTAEFISNYFSKGQECIVEGYLSTRSYEDKDGNSRSITELTVDKVHFCGPKKDGQGQAKSNQAGSIPEGDPLMNDPDPDSLPF